MTHPSVSQGRPFHTNRIIFHFFQVLHFQPLSSFGTAFVVSRNHRHVFSPTHPLQFYIAGGTSSPAHCIISLAPSEIHFAAHALMFPTTDTGIFSKKAHVRLRGIEAAQTRSKWFPSHRSDLNRRAAAANFLSGHLSECCSFVFSPARLTCDHGWILGWVSQSATINRSIEQSINETHPTSPRAVSCPLRGYRNCHKLARKRWQHPM